MIRVQHARDGTLARIVLRRALPRHIEHPLDPILKTRQFVRTWRQTRKAVDLFLDFCARFVAHFELFQALFVFIRFEPRRVFVAKFFLNRLYLFAQEVFPLGFFDLFAHL